MERLSEKVDYMQQEQIEMESNQDAIRRDMEKLKTGRSLYVDIAREEEANSGEARERDATTRLLDALKGQRNEDPVRKKYPTPLKNGNYLLNSGDERQMQKIFDQVKPKITRVDISFDMIEKLMIEIFKTLRMEDLRGGVWQLASLVLRFYSHQYLEVEVHTSLGLIKMYMILITLIRYIPVYNWFSLRF